MLCKLVIIPDGKWFILKREWFAKKAHSYFVSNQGEKRSRCSASPSIFNAGLMQKSTCTFANHSRLSIKALFPLRTGVLGRGTYAYVLSKCAAFCHLCAKLSSLKNRTATLGYKKLEKPHEKPIIKKGLRSRIATKGSVQHCLHSWHFMPYEGLVVIGRFCF